MVAPTTSYPRSTRIAAATDESTPPDIATRTRSPVTRSPVTSAHPGQAARLLDQRRKERRHALDAVVGGERPEAHPHRRRSEVGADAERAEHVRRRHTSALAGRPGRRGDA